MLRTRISPLNAIWLVAVLAIWVRCTFAVADNVVARIADREITAEMLLQFEADTPALLRSEHEDVEALKDYLHTLIDMELMLLEAEALQLELEMDFARRWEDERKRKLIFEFQMREIMSKVEVSPEEMMELYAKSKWSRIVQLARIRVKTLEEAEQVMRELEEGGDFAGLALERSVDEETARQGGRLDYFLGRSDLEERGFSLVIAEELFELDVGAFSRLYRNGDVYEVFQVVDQRPAPPGYAMIFTRTRLAQEFHTLRRALMDTLSREYEVKCEPTNIAFAINLLSAATAKRRPPSALEEEMVLCQLSDGQITIKDLYNVFLEDGSLKPSASDTAAVARSLWNNLLPEALFYRAALQRGIAQDSSVVAWLTTKKQSMLVEAVKARAVDRQIDLSEEALRRYYRDHLDRFKSEAEIQIVEILVQTRQEAEQLLGRVGSGESMEELAIRHSIREGARQTRGRLHLHPGRSGHHYGELYAAVIEAKVGALQGPVEISPAVGPGGYSVFKVMEKIPRTPLSFVQVATRVRYWLRQEEEARITQAMFQELRNKYAEKIIILEETIRAIRSGS